MKSNNLVSIIVPAFNHEDYVEICLESIFNQTYAEIELLIVNDGSTDQTHQKIQNWLEKCPDRFLRVEYINRENRGLTNTLNQGLKWANGIYFSAIASDDILEIDKISLLVSELEKKGESYGAAFGNAKFIDGKGEAISLEIKDSTGAVITKTALFLEHYTYGRKFNFRDPAYFGTYSSLLAGNYLPAMSTLVRTESIREEGGWTAGNTVEDWEMWLKLSKNSRFAYVDQIVASYRWHEGNTSKIKRERILRDSIKLLENEMSYATVNSYHNGFFPVYLFNVRLLKEFDRKEYKKKMIKLLLNKSFLRFVSIKIRQRRNA
ncbi:glycosyltransferase family 2 protein [Algoriphagus antarcticus]|uniref:glycosyltransferase family 2 protein n=1 Tax=Algoriphagus antarcticus TaxID=238540 RepID=UPI001B870948|nr:glycosyltransferase family 2 protein [Algoriphagus antarcticus]